MFIEGESKAMSWNKQSQISEISSLLICSQDRVAKLPRCAGVYTLSGVGQTLRYRVSRAEWCLSDLEKEEDVARSLQEVDECWYCRECKCPTNKIPFGIISHTVAAFL